MPNGTQEFANWYIIDLHIFKALDTLIGMISQYYQAFKGYLELINIKTFSKL